MSTTISIIALFLAIASLIKVKDKNQEIMMLKTKVDCKERSNAELWDTMSKYRDAINESNELVDKLLDANKQHKKVNKILKEHRAQDKAVIDEIYRDYLNYGLLRDSVFDYYSLLQSTTKIERILATLPTPKEAPGELSDDEPSIQDKLAELEANSFMEV